MELFVVQISDVKDAAILMLLQHAVKAPSWINQNEKAKKKRKIGEFSSDEMLTKMQRVLDSYILFVQVINGVYSL